LDTAARLLRTGQLVAFPTETVYGLGANALDAEAVARIYAAKGRPSINPLIVHIADVAQAQELAEWNEQADRLAARFWPGPLTLVLPKREVVPAIVTAGGPSVALRLPAHRLALDLLQSTGCPLAAPSANRSGQLSPTTAAHVLADLQGRIAAVLDGGPTTAGIESTVVDVRAGVPRLLRPGPIPPSQLEAVVGSIERTAAATAGPFVSPGMMDRHYSPRTPLILAPDEGVDLVANLLAQGERVGWLGRFPASVPVAEVLPTDPVGYAAGLYAALHRLDAIGLNRIVVAALPTGEDWLALRDRLRRAAISSPDP
jgi:L-threonylcarbamoyladenylate synthase